MTYGDWPFFFFNISEKVNDNDDHDYNEKHLGHNDHIDDDGDDDDDGYALADLKR